MSIINYVENRIFCLLILTICTYVNQRITDSEMGFGFGELTKINLFRWGISWNINAMIYEYRTQNESKANV